MSSRPTVAMLKSRPYGSATVSSVRIRDHRGTRGVPIPQRLDEPGAAVLEQLLADREGRAPVRQVHPDVEAAVERQPGPPEGAGADHGPDVDQIVRGHGPLTDNAGNLPC
jgi:hypothetical protein